MRTEDGHIIQKCLDGDSAAFGLLAHGVELNPLDLRPFMWKVDDNQID